MSRSVDQEWMSQAKKEEQKKSLGQSGQTLTEYLSLLILISLVAVGTVGKLGRTIKRQIKSAEEKIDSITYTSSRGDKTHEINQRDEEGF